MEDDAVLAHKVMVEGAADMYDHEPGDYRADQAVYPEQLLGEQAVLRPDLAATRASRTP
jgi:hypothetical protein